jgi:hypothetical protein
MAEDEDREIASALAELAEQDAAVAEDARAALEWVAGEPVRASITRERIQVFCWYELPVKWFVDLEEELRIISALAEALDLLQLPRYAAICRSGETREILNAYEVSTEHGHAAFRRAAAASGIVPPDLPDFEWGAVGWLLTQLDDGIALTQTGNLSRKFVQQSADRFGWDFPQPPRTEDELFDLQQLRHFAQDLGLARRPGGTLKLTAKGRRLLADPGSLWRAVAAGLLGDNDFAVFAGELFLALLLDAGSVPDIQIKATVGQAVTEEGSGRPGPASHWRNVTSAGPSTKRATCAGSPACWPSAVTGATAATGSPAPARPPPSPPCGPGPPARERSHGPDLPRAQHPRCWCMYR